METTERKVRGTGIVMRNLKYHRERAGFSQRDLEQASGVGHARISNLETGTSGAQGRTVRRLAAALGVSTAELVGD